MSLSFNVLKRLKITPRFMRRSILELPTITEKSLLFGIIYIVVFLNP